MDYILPSDYFGTFTDVDGITAAHRRNAAGLLVLVNRLLAAALKNGITLPNNPHTNSLVSGETLGGWRPQSCPIGAPQSAHKTGEAVDVYDPEGHLDDWLTDDRLQQCGLYREHPSATRGWVHLTSRAPKSGRRSFYP